MMPYSPEAFEPLTFFDAVPRFRDGSDTPSAYLERCLEVIAERQPVVKARSYSTCQARPRGGGRIGRALPC
jgi:hypothetical protein